MRKTKIMGFSVPPEIYGKLEKTIKSRHKTKSEFFRELVDSYYKMNRNTPPSELNLAEILRSYWTKRSELKENIILIALAIITNNGKVLIGVRKEKDKWVENLSWVFPGGKIRSLNFDEEIQREVKNETGLDIKSSNLVAARVHPDSGFKDVQIVALYFHCNLVDSDQTCTPSGDLKELKWVKPTDVFKYFTTSTCDAVTKFLTTIEKPTK